MDGKKDLKHGTAWTYDRHKCRCAICKMAKRIRGIKKYYKNHEHYLEYNRIAKAKRVAAGACHQCGWAIEEERKPRTTCFLCAETNMLAQRERMALHYERGFK